MLACILHKPQLVGLTWPLRQLAVLYCRFSVISLRECCGGCRFSQLSAYLSTSWSDCSLPSNFVSGHMSMWFIVCINRHLSWKRLSVQIHATWTLSDMDLVLSGKNWAENAKLNSHNNTIVKLAAAALSATRCKYSTDITSLSLRVQNTAVSVQCRQDPVVSSSLMFNSTAPRSSFHARCIRLKLHGDRCLPAQHLLVSDNSIQYTVNGFIPSDTQHPSSAEMHSS